MRTLAITGIETVSIISRIIRGAAMRATPPSLRISEGTRSSAITAQAPASSAILACSAFVTSIITPPFSISARPTLTRHSLLFSDSISILPTLQFECVPLVPFRRRFRSCFFARGSRFPISHVRLEQRDETSLCSRKQLILRRVPDFTLNHQAAALHLQLVAL